MIDEKELEKLKEEVVKALKTIYDPELPVNIWELGLIYDIQITAMAEVVILMTLTAPNCPEAEQIPVEVEQKVKEIKGITNAKVIITFEPPWDRSMLSEVAKFQLGLF